MCFFGRIFSRWIYIGVGEGPDSRRIKCTIRSRDVLLRSSTRGHPSTQSRNIILFRVGLKFKTKIKFKKKNKKKGLGLKQK